MTKRREDKRSIMLEDKAQVYGRSEDQKSMGPEGQRKRTGVLMTRQLKENSTNWWGVSKIAFSKPM